MIDLPVSAVSCDQTPKMYISKSLKIKSVSKNHGTLLIL